MAEQYSEIVPPKQGRALVVRKGEHLRITDLEGQQVVDVALFNLHNLREKLSLSYSTTRYAMQQSAAARGEEVPPGLLSRDYLTEGDILMSTIFSPMMTIVRDTPAVKGVHKVNQRMCNRRFYESFGIFGREGCHENISRAVAPWGLMPEDIPDTIDFFMNYHHDCGQRRWVADMPVSKAGDFVELRAEMDCLVGLSNCPEDVIAPINGFHCTPIRLQVFDGPGA